MSSLRFSERMAGWVAFGERDFNQGFAAGRAAGNACGFRLTIEIDDVDRFVSDPAHVARATGSVHCDQLGGELAVESGTFNLLVETAGPRERRMLYRLLLRDPEGRALTLAGFKELRDDPNFDLGGDTTTLFTRLFAGHVEQDPPQRDDGLLASGILRIGPRELARMATTFRAAGGSPLERLRAHARFHRLFAGGLATIYRGAATEAAREDFPGADPYQGFGPLEWHPLPGRPAVARQIVPFRADDGFECNLHHLRREPGPTRGPVLLVQGAASRANLFYDVPGRTSIADVLLEAGYDVWIENWRGSIDFAVPRYTLDQVAAFDHPAAVRTIQERTGRDELKAIVHCQGSTSFVMALVAGLLPTVTTVVSNSVSLHVDLTRLSNLKLRTLVPPGSLALRGMDPQWTIRAPSAVAAGFAAWAKFVRRGCGNPVCAAANYIYGAHPDVLWRHENVDAATHRWISREFGYAPFSFFEQMRRCAQAGHLVPVEGLDALPQSFVDEPPRTDARLVFITGSRNVCFLPSSQRRSFQHFDAMRPDYHSFHCLPGYSHFDVFFGKDSARRVFPLILDELDRPGWTPRRRFVPGERAAQQPAGAPAPGGSG